MSGDVADPILAADAVPMPAEEVDPKNPPPSDDPIPLDPSMTNISDPADAAMVAEKVAGRPLATIEGILDQLERAYGRRPKSILLSAFKVGDVLVEMSQAVPAGKIRFNLEPRVCGSFYEYEEDLP